MIGKMRLFLGIFIPCISTCSYAQEITYMYNGVIIKLIQGDITTQRVDAIVNAANVALQHRGGVALAISDAAGSNLQIASDILVENNGLFEPGTAVETESFNLKKQGVKKIIHAFGPNLSDPEQNRHKEALLRNAYMQSLEIANNLELQSIAFPSISTKLFGYDIKEATPIAIKAVRDYLETSNSSITEIRFIVFDTTDFSIYKSIFDTMLTQQSTPTKSKQLTTSSVKKPVALKMTSKTIPIKKATAQNTIKKTPKKIPLKVAQKPVHATKAPQARRSVPVSVKKLAPLTSKKAPIATKKTASRTTIQSRTSTPSQTNPLIKSKTNITTQKTTQLPELHKTEPIKVSYQEKPKSEHVIFKEGSEILEFQNKKYIEPLSAEIQLQKTIVNPNSLEYSIIGQTQKIIVIKGDFFKTTDSNVWINPSDKELSNTSGLSGSIKKAAGENFQNDLNAQIRSGKKFFDFSGIFKPGEYLVTPGYDLKSKGVEFIISTTGPNSKFSGHANHMNTLLKTTYNECLKAAENLSLPIKNVQFPSISTRGFGYPIKEAAPIAIKTILNYFILHPDSTIKTVSIVLSEFTDDFNVYENNLDNYVITTIPIESITYTLYDVLKNRLPNNTKIRTKNNLDSSFIGSILGGAIGDALGRVTEFDKPLATIFTKRPQGVIYFSDFTQSDWLSIPQQYQTANPKIAPWTDDTAMAKIVLEQLIAMKQNKWDFDTTIGAIAHATINDEKNELGWAAGFRAPGGACKTGSRILKQKTTAPQLEKDWWNIQAVEAGGCGSVMRAHPFGLAFWYNQNRAAHFAMAGSKITHGAPIAVAGSAVMAVAIALAVKQESVENIVLDLIERAKKYAPHAAPNTIFNPSGMTLAEKIERAEIDAQAAAYAYQNNDRDEFNRIHEQFFTKFEGWSADDAVAGAIFAFCLFPDDLMRAIAVGVHTPGDSDSIASMAGALVGAYVGEGQVPTDKELGAQLEQRKELTHLAKELANLCKPTKPTETPIIATKQTVSLPDYLLSKIATPQAITNLITDLKQDPYAKMDQYPEPTPNWANEALKPYIWFYDKNDPYYEFANFFKRPVIINGLSWPTTEHYFQAEKFTLDPTLQEQIRQMLNSSDVFKLANAPENANKKRTDWDDETTFIPLMYTALVAKFTQHPALQKILLDTKNAIIIEDTAKAIRDDMRWGAGKNYQGENYLGRLLMYIRDEIKKYNSGT